MRCGVPTFDESLEVPIGVSQQHKYWTVMTVRVGLIGAGNIAKNRHIPVFQNCDRAEVTGIIDRDDKVGREVADNVDVPYRSSIDELCSHADLISVCTPPWLHHEHSNAALENGCHVITEKPMAMTTDEADEMIQRAEDNDRLLTVVQNFLYKDSFVETRQLLNSGELGELSRTFSIQLKKTDRSDRHGHHWFDKLPGGLFWDESPHMIYLTHDFIGDMSLQKAESTPREGEKQTHKTVRAKFEGENNAAEGNVVMLFDSPITEWWFVIIGSDGIVFVDIFRDTVMKFDREGEHSPDRVLYVLLSGISQMLYGSFQTGLSYLRERLQSGYTIPEAGFSVQVEKTLQAIEEGTEPPVTAQEGRQIVEWMENIVSEGGMEIE